MLLGCLQEVRLVLVVVQECAVDHPMKDLVENCQMVEAQMVLESGQCSTKKMLREVYR